MNRIFKQLAAVLLALVLLAGTALAEAGGICDLRHALLC